MSLRDIFNQVLEDVGINDQRSSSDQNITPLVSSIGTNPNFGEKLQRKDIGGSVWEKLEGKGSSKHHVYPLNLGTDDAENFLFIKIYQGHSEAFSIAERKVQHLEYVKNSVDAISGIKPGEQKDAAMQAFGEEIDRYYNDNGAITQHSSEAHNFAAVERARKSLNSNELTLEIENAKSSLKTAKTQENDDLATKRSQQQSNRSRADSQSTARIRKADFQMGETIALYLPQKLNVAGMNTYDTPEFALLKDIEGMASGDMKALAGTFIRKVAGAGDDLAQMTGTDLNAKRGIAAAYGSVLNPRRETLFVSPEMRKFEFAFEFTPRNEKESLAVKDIVETLRKHAYPRLAQGGYFYHMPAEFHLEYYKINSDGSVSPNEWLNRILPSVLQEVNVDYTGSGQVSMFESGAPTHINMTLSFQETELLHHERIIDGY